MTRTKICGITRSPDRDAALDAGADAVGVVCDVAVDTPREVDRGTATDLLSGVPPFVTGVLVTMPATVQDVVRLARTVDPDAVQVHGTLSPAEVGALTSRFSGPVLTGVAVDDDLGAYAEVADALLVDSLDEARGGGTGETTDWAATRAAVDAVDAPVVLAGGLTPENVAEAVRTVRPHGVDTASGVEREGGVKDHDAVERFVREAHAAEVAA